MTLTKEEFYWGWNPSSRYQKLFNAYNKKYFDGKLPNVVVGLAPLLKIEAIEEKGTSRPRKKTVGAYGFAGISQKDGSFYIVLDKGMSVFHSGFAKITLLHEMCHFEIGLDKGHGKLFKAQIRRLASLGAFDNLI